MTPVYKLSANSVKNGRILYGSMLAGNTAFEKTDFYSIATINPSGSTSNVTFSNIPQDYTHLQLRVSTKEANNGTSNWYGLEAQFNGDTGSNYNDHFLITYAVTGGGAQTNVADNAVNATKLYFGIPSRGNGDDVTFGGFITDILDYTNTNKFKTTRTIGGFCFNATPNRLDLISGCWRSTSAVTSISINFAGNYANYSSFALYGIRTA